MHYKLLILLLLLTATFKSFAQTIDFLANKREVSTTDREHPTPRITSTDNVVSRVTIDSTTITILTFAEGSVSHRKSTFRITKKRSYIVRNCKYWFYMSGNYIIVHDCTKQTVTVIYSKHYKPRKKPLTILPARVWYTRTTRIVYYGILK